VPIEPLLIAGDPGLHIESVRPAMKALMIDGIKSYVSNLATGRAVISSEMIHELTERIINPRSPRKRAPARAVPPPSAEYEPPQQDASRARAIFDAAQEAQPFNPSDFDFAMDDEQATEPPLASTSMPVGQESSPAQPLPRPKPRRKRILGMTPVQLGIIAALGLAMLCLAVAAVYLFLF
jgi:hypothetical protein